MFKITDLKAGEFIDLLEYSKALVIADENSISIIKEFYDILIGRLPTTEAECFEIINEFDRQIEEIKEEFEFIYNPPPLPSTIDQSQSTIGDEYRKDFSETYGGYVELVYLLCSVFKFKPNEVLEMKCQDFLFWGNYCLHKKYVESIK